MKTRDYYFLREKTVSDTDTITIPIEVKDPLSFLKVEVEATNGATSNTGPEIHACVGAIEVLDGSRVIESLSMSDWLAVSAYNLGYLPPQVITEQGGQTQECSIYILFGRYPNDPEFYFNPAVFKNPQIRISLSLAISATAGFATGTGRVTVIGRLIEEGAAGYKGFIQRKYVEKFTAGTSGDKTVVLYTDYPYRTLYVRALLSGTSPLTSISKMKMSCDADKYVPFENYSEDILDEMIARYGLFKHRKTIFRADNAVVPFQLHEIRGATYNVLPDFHVGNFEAISANTGTTALYVLSATPTIAKQTTAQVIQAEINGTLVNGTFAIPLYEKDEPGEYFPATDFGDIRLILTQGAAADCAVILEQVAT